MNKRRTILSVLLFALLIVQLVIPKTVMSDVKLGLRSGMAYPSINFDSTSSDLVKREIVLSKEEAYQPVLSLLYGVGIVLDKPIVPIPLSIDVLYMNKNNVGKDYVWKLYPPFNYKDSKYETFWYEIPFIFRQEIVKTPLSKFFLGAGGYLSFLDWAAEKDSNGNVSYRLSDNPDETLNLQSLDYGFVLSAGVIIGLDNVPFNLTAEVRYDISLTNMAPKSEPDAKISFSTLYFVLGMNFGY